MLTQWVPCFITDLETVSLLFRSWVWGTQQPSWFLPGRHHPRLSWWREFCRVTEHQERITPTNRWVYECSNIQWMRLSHNCKNPVSLIIMCRVKSKLVRVNYYVSLMFSTRFTSIACVDLQLEEFDLQGLPPPPRIIRRYIIMLVPHHLNAPISRKDW